YAKIEQNQLLWQKMNQRVIRAELYQGLADAMASDSQNLNYIGTQIILPASFVGSNRYMSQYYQDAMAIVRKYGKPSLFITITCNPHWPEILAELYDKQVPNDRPDIIVRIFNLKLKAILNDIIDKNILGKVVVFVLVIEFQKRGLPHAYLLIILTNEDNPQEPSDYDNIVSAEIPDPIHQSQLYETITRYMIHGPCGSLAPHAPCMQDGICSKNYPRHFANVTRDDANGYPLYRRRNNGRSIQLRGHILDN
ncbi:3651_t:CDS:1, partial [Acaulospora morrowiae]